MNVAAAIGGFVGLVVLIAFGQVLVGVPGLMIYSALFTRGEYDPDHEREVDVNSFGVWLTGIAFWLALIGGAYGIYRLAA
jgi:hypothetical protein